MKKLAFVIIAIMILSLAAGIVYAKGGTSGGKVVKNVAEVKEDERPDCEEKNTVRERIECRLEFGQLEPTVPEPCRQVPSKKDKCEAYYSDILPCYEKRGKPKDQCFQEVGKFERIGVRSQLQVNDNPWPVELYALGLLYDLEEKVEDGYADFAVTKSEGSALIEEIVELKVMVLNRESPGKIKAGVQALRAKWPASIK